MTGCHQCGKCCRPGDGMVWRALIYEDDEKTLYPGWAWKERDV